MSERKGRNLPPLPTSWKWTTVGELTEVVRGASPRPKGDPRYFGGPIPWIMISDVTKQPGKYLYRTREGVTPAGAELSRKILAGELILSNSGTVCVPKILKIDGCIHDGFVAFPTLKQRVDLNFAYYWFECVRQTIIQENRQGVTQVNLNTGIVRDMHFPLAPIDQQHEIVAEIEKQFTRLEAGVAGLRRVQANLKRYRAAVLKAACEGKLVPTEAELARQEGRRYQTGAELLELIISERRKKPHGKVTYKEPVKPETNTLPALPQGWAWASLEQIGQADRPIIYGIIKPGPHVSTGVPYVRVTEMKDGRIDVPNLRRASRERAAKFARATLAPGDILISKDGTIGRVAVVPPELAGGNITQHVMRAPLSSAMLRDYVVWAIRSDHCQRWLTGETRGVALRGVNVEDFRRLPVPIPPLAEQQRIVAEVERRLSVVEELEAVVKSNLQRATRLRQSILQRAFEGKLVETDRRASSLDAHDLPLAAESPASYERVR